MTKTFLSGLIGDRPRVTTTHFPPYARITAYLPLVSSSFSRRITHRRFASAIPNSLTADGASALTASSSASPFGAFGSSALALALFRFGSNLMTGAPGAAAAAALAYSARASASSRVSFVVPAQP